MLNGRLRESGLIKKNFRLFYTVGILCIFPFLIAGRSYFEPTQENVKTGCKVYDVVEIDENRFPLKVLDQKNTGTCFGHAAHSLLRYHYNVQQIHHDQQPTLKHLSVIDVLGKGFQRLFWLHFLNDNLSAKWPAFSLRDLQKKMLSQKLNLHLAL